MKKIKKLEPQSSQSAWQWLTSFTPKPDEGKGPLLQLAKVIDGRAYATNTNILASVSSALYSDLDGTLYQKNQTVESDVQSANYFPALLTITKVFGNEFTTNTEDLIAALKRVAVLCKSKGRGGSPALFIRDREGAVAYLYAADGQGAAVTCILGVTNFSADDEAYTRYTGGWIFPDQWIKILKGWSKGKHGWPDAAGVRFTRLTFKRPVDKIAKPGVPNWFSDLVKLEPAYNPLGDAPFAVIMNQLAELGIQTGEQAIELAESAKDPNEYWPEGGKGYHYTPIKNDLNLPLFQGVSKFELGKAPSKEVWQEQKVTESYDQSIRARKHIAMRNHPTMIPYWGVYVADGSDEKFIEAIKASQRP